MKNKYKFQRVYFNVTNKTYIKIYLKKNIIDFK